jgi:DNA uptake protein ComE-like DNA-binding protein
MRPMASMIRCDGGIPRYARNDQGETGLSLRNQRGSVLIIVLWICLGLVTLTLYFAHAVNAELQASANQVGEIEARAAVDGATRYAAYVLNNFGINGVVPHSGIAPDPEQDYYSADLTVDDQSGNPGDNQKGAPRFWFIGRDPNNPPTAMVGPTNPDPVFSLVDESSKLNLNTATATMLDLLPMMTNASTDVGASIVAWRTRSQSSSSAAANQYSTLDPARTNKGAPFESTDELRLVYGASLDILLGEDTNRNGALDPNEDDGDQSPPHDNQDGQLQPGMLEYVTAFSSQPITTTTGGNRINITTLAARARLSAQMTRQGISSGNAARYIRTLGAQTCSSVADFMIKSRMSASDFALLHTSITASTATTGFVNVNTASATVLSCLPGLGQDNAQSIVNYRLANPTVLTSFAWLPQVISSTLVQRIGPYITDQSYRFSADIAAIGRNGRGYCREMVVFDTSLGLPRIIYRQDFSSYGWALGPQIRQEMKSGQLN